MNRMMTFKSVLAILFSTFFLSFGFQIKEVFPQSADWIKVVSVFAALMLGPQLAIILANLSYKWVFVRKIVLGRSWIEGVWILETYVDQGFNAVGLSQVSYEGNQCDLQVHAYFPDESGKEPKFSMSSSVLLRDKDLFYVNYFLATRPNCNLLGVAIGNYFVDSGRRHPTRYDGKVLYLGEEKSSRQIGYKLSDKEVRALVKEHPENWKDVALSRHLSGRKIIFFKAA